MKMNLTKKSGVATVLALGLAVAAKADSTVTYTSTANGTFDFPSTALALQQFNPSLGTLQSVTLSLSGTSSTTLSVFNSSPSTYGSPSTVWNDVEILLGNSSFDQAVNALNPNANSYALPNAWLDVTSPHFSVAGLTSGNTQNFTGNNTGASGQPAVTSTITSGTIFADLQGTGKQNLDVLSDSTVDSAISGGATFSANETVTGGVTATVTYDYIPAPVPEPSTAAIFGLGLGSLMVFLRRRSN